MQRPGVNRAVSNVQVLREQAAIEKGNKGTQEFREKRELGGDEGGFVEPGVMGAKGTTTANNKHQAGNVALDNPLAGIGLDRLEGPLLRPLFLVCVADLS
jgi:hypothetical protein